MERGKKPFDPFGQKASFTLSASHLNKYEKCPFIFASEKLFRLKEPRLWDMTLDPLTLGQLLHTFLEFLSEKPIKPKPSSMEIEACFEKAIEKMALDYLPEGLKKSFKKRYLDWGHRFLDMEEKWQTHCPQRQRAVAREEFFSFYISSSPPFIRKERAHPKDIHFRGCLDRLDLDEKGKRALVLDYKSSHHGLNNTKNWMKRQTDPLQLLIYTLVVEKGLRGEEPIEVVAALYYVVKERSLKKGFVVKTKADTLLDLTPYKGTRSLYMTQEEKEAMLSKVEVYLMEKVDQMQKGQFLPQPLDRRICPECSWRRLCRHPDLNI